MRLWKRGSAVMWLLASAALLAEAQTSSSLRKSPQTGTTAEVSMNSRLSSGSQEIADGMHISGRLFEQRVGEASKDPELPEDRSPGGGVSPYTNGRLAEQTLVQEAAKDPEVPDDQRYEGLGVSGYTN